MTDKLSEAKNTVESLYEATQSVSPDNAIGRVSRMDAIGNKAVNELALKKAKNKIKQKKQNFVVVLVWVVGL